MSERAAPAPETTPSVDDLIVELISAAQFAAHDPLGTRQHVLVDARKRLSERVAEMEAALRRVLDAHNTDARGWPSKTVGGDDVVYHLDGQRMYAAINAARAALPPERAAGTEKESGR